MDKLKTFITQLPKQINKCEEICWRTRKLLLFPQFNYLSILSQESVLCFTAISYVNHLLNLFRSYGLKVPLLTIIENNGAYHYQSAPRSILESHKLYVMTLEFQKECGRNSMMQSLTAINRAGTNSHSTEDEGVKFDHSLPTYEDASQILSKISHLLYYICFILFCFGYLTILQEIT